jgi:hypothetical protein
MNKKQLSTFVVLAGIIAASSVLALGTTTQTALAQGAASCGSATDVGSSSTSSGANFFSGESSCSSSAGDDSEAEANGEEVRSSATR